MSCSGSHKMNPSNIAPLKRFSSDWSSCSPNLLSLSLSLTLCILFPPLSCATFLSFTNSPVYGVNGWHCLLNQPCYVLFSFVNLVVLTIYCVVISCDLALPIVLNSSWHSTVLCDFHAPGQIYNALVLLSVSDIRAQYKIIADAKMRVRVFLLCLLSASTLAVQAQLSHSDARYSLRSSHRYAKKELASVSDLRIISINHTCWCEAVCLCVLCLNYFGKSFSGNAISILQSWLSVLGGFFGFHKYFRWLYIQQLSSCNKWVFFFFFFFFFLRKIIVQYKCWKGRCFGSEEGREKEVREVGKEKKTVRKRGFFCCSPKEGPSFRVKTSCENGLL